MTKFELQVWSKVTNRYEVTWSGRDFVRAQIVAAKPYNNRHWQGKKRIVSIRTFVELEIPHLPTKIRR
jgi:hypothetical protein